MDTKYKISVRFGKHLSYRFDAIEVPYDGEGRRAFARVNSVKCADAESGMVAIDFKKKQVVATYDGVVITSSIFYAKELEGNYHMRCVTDLFVFDVYVTKADSDLSVFDRLADE